MSIINEALKKAGQDKPSAADNPVKNLIPEPAKKKQKVNWGPVFVIMVLVLITGPLVAPIFSSPYRSTNSAFLVPSYQEALATQKIQAGNSDTRLAQFAIEESPVLSGVAAGVKNVFSGPALGDRPDFAINGIVYSSPNSYCIINGRVLRVGDKVNGAVLKSVTPEKAVLDYNGTKIDLWVDHA